MKEELDKFARYQWQYQSILVFFINMIKAGEASGMKDETLKRLKARQDKQHYMKQDILLALAYPIVAAVVAIAIEVVLFLLTNVVPAFVGMFAAFGANLPRDTVFILDFSKNRRENLHLKECEGRIAQ
ncbi:type II secretory pathway component PulF [Cytobacillus horneckiae]|uniref:type II secretion system F family protein n=1 Tax=Cytobacillus horneckiae TaxID=549687 RepID=UPI0019CFC520|nr:type II secretion system F family protein [Cytobacillus horneckiae]MBN6887880.1 type II secretion system F family protein [Cytobacillus horneckiae]